MFHKTLCGLLASLLVIGLMALPVTSYAAGHEAPRFNGSNLTTLNLRPPATIFRIALTQPDDHRYNSTDNIQVNIFTDRAGGGLENDIALQSQNIAQGDSTVSLGAVPAPGLYFTRYKVSTDVFTNAFLVLPIDSQFTVQIVAAPTCTAPVAPGQTGAVEKFFRNLTLARLRTAAGAVAPAWFAVNGQNFVVQLAKGIVLAYSGLGFIAVFVQNGIAQETMALGIDFLATVLARVADDLQTAAVLTAAERTVVKQVITLINGVAQTRLSETGLGKVVSIGQAIAEGLLGEDQDIQVLAKVVGDSVKKFEVLVKLAPKP
jgi:hypothetical protein